MEKLPTKLATALLLYEGEVSISDIEALPYVEDRRMAIEIANYLKQKFDTRAGQRRVRGLSGLSAWEDVIVLQTPTSLERTGGSQEQVASLKL